MALTTASNTLGKHGGRIPRSGPASVSEPLVALRHPVEAAEIDL